MLQPKLPVNINNQYPMSRSPPMFDSSSPGPDPYHSLQSLHNVYEELHPTQDSDADSEFRGHSDDDFAEDELSLAGETTAVLMATSTSTSASTPNHPDSASGGQSSALIPANYTESNINYRRNDAASAVTAASNIERDSVLSLTSTNERNGAGDSSTSSRSSSGATRISRNAHEAGTNGPFVRGNSKTLNNHRDINNTPDRIGLAHNFNQYHNHVNNGNGSGVGGAVSSSTSSSNNKRMNSNRINNNTMANTMHHHHHHSHQHQQANNNVRTSKSRDNICGGGGASCVECRVERQNAVNRQMSSTMHNKKRTNGAGHERIDPHHGGISTIFHGRTMNGNNGHFGYPQEQQHQWTNGNHRMRTMPYATTNVATATHDPAYDYAQPVFHEGLLYDSGFAADVGRLQQPMDRNLDCSYIAPEYTSLGSSASGMSVTGGHLPQNIYSRDSSFGSDSGYSRGESGGSASGNVLGLGLGRLKKHNGNGGNRNIGKSVL